MSANPVVRAGVRGRRAASSTLDDALESAGSWLDATEELGEKKAESMFSGDTRVGRAAQSGTVIAVVVIGVIALVGILIMAQVEDALPELSANETDENYSPLAGTEDEVVGGFGDAMGFVPIILIVLLASIVIAVVQRMR